MDTKILVALEQLGARELRVTFTIANCPKELKPEILSELLKNMTNAITNAIKENA